MLCSLGSGVNRETYGPGRASHLQQKQALNDSGEVVGLYGSTPSGPFSGYTRIAGVFSTVM